MRARRRGLPFSVSHHGPIAPLPHCPIVPSIFALPYACHVTPRPGTWHPASTRPNFPISPREEASRRGGFAGPAAAGAMGAWHAAAAPVQCGALNLHDVNVCACRAALLGFVWVCGRGVNLSQAVPVSECAPASLYAATSSKLFHCSASSCNAA